MSFQLILALAFAGLLHGSLASMQCCSRWKSAPGSGRCFLIVNTTKTWEDAKQSCEEIGTMLARPRTNAENVWLLEQTGNVSLWISANDHVTEGTWVWEDGSPLDVKEDLWYPGEPNNLGDEDCGSVRDVYQSWNDAQCSSLYAYACQTCMEGWIQRPGFSNKCYYIEKTNLKNWEDARQSCNALNATLAKPRTVEESVWLLQQTGNVNVWISANDHVAEGTWVWEDGSALDLEEDVWYPGEPNNLGDEDCGSVRDAYQSWNDAQCSSLYAYACEI